MSNLVRLTRNTNIGKKGDLVPDPTGHLVNSHLAVALGDAVKEVSDGAVKSEIESDETSESQDQPEPTEVEDKKTFKRKDR
jgi:hypothetical protein